MTRKSLPAVFLTLTLMVWTCASSADADETKPSAALAPLPMRTKQPIVYATPIKTMVILEFKLYDNKTWCRLYIKKAHWEAIRANNGELPEGDDKGQLQCEQR